MGELRNMISFLSSKAQPLVSEASTSERIKKGGVSSCHLGGGSPCQASRSVGFGVKSEVIWICSGGVV